MVMLKFAYMVLSSTVCDRSALYSEFLAEAMSKCDCLTTSNHLSCTELQTSLITRDPCAEYQTYMGHLVKDMVSYTFYGAHQFSALLG